MPRLNRAAQFAPFDALKGLYNALRLKEYEHDKIAQSDLPEDKVIEISNKLAEMKKGDIVEITYYNDGYISKIKGPAKLILEERLIIILDKNIQFSTILDIYNYSK